MSKDTSHLSHRGIVQSQDTGEENHPRANPVPGASGEGKHEETQAPHVPNVDKALKQD